MSDDVLRVVALTIACLFGLWTAVACRRAQYHGLPGSDALIWAGLSGAFFLLSLMKTARGLGLLRGIGGFLRDIFRQRGWYEDRRSLQIAASIAIAVVVIALIVWASCGLGITLSVSPRHRLYGPDFRLRDHSLHFSARSRRMECASAMGAHCRRPRRRCGGIGGSHRPALAAKGFCSADSQD